MNKKIVAILFATLLLTGGVVSLLADKINISLIVNTLMGNSNYEITQFSAQDSPPNPCGVGNGGGGDPG